MKPDALIPSMFHRRLILLAGMTALAMVLLSGRLAWLTVAQGDEWLREAESRLVTETWTPTVRGRILDRKGRVLAEDRPSFDVAVEYRVITGDWAYQQAAVAARRANRTEWAKLSPAQRDGLIAERLPEYARRLEDTWRLFAQTAGIDREELELRKQAIIERVERMASTIWGARVKRARDQLRDAETDEIPTIVRRPIREQTIRHPILRGVDDRTAFNFRSLLDQMPGVAVVDAGVREYPCESMDVIVSRASLPAPLRRDTPVTMHEMGVATHILGWMRSEPVKEDYERRPSVDPATGEPDRRRYLPGDAVGATGVEAQWEDALRGLRGVVINHLDTGRREEVRAKPGQDVRLTIDIALQARVQAILDPAFGLTTVQEWHELVDAGPDGDDQTPERRRKLAGLGEHLNGAAVIVEIESGDVLAMVSSPTFTRAGLQSDPAAIFQDPLDQPWVNRPLSRPYQPGSIVKPLVLVEAATRGAHRLDDPIECDGHFLPNRKDILRCWIYRARFGWTTHSMQLGGPLYGPDAIAHSCNIYFYTLGRALNIDGMNAFYRRYGVGDAFDTGVPGASPGLLGRTDATMTAIDAAMMAIGQGPVSWTPLQAATAYATLARRGVFMPPRVVASLERQPEDLRLDKAAIDQALDGLRKCVADPGGTANHLTIDGRREDIFNALGVRVLGKTGTAQASPTIGPDPADPGSGRNVVLREGEHGWTLALVGPEGGPPRYAVAVIIEHAGSGGRVAGPVANQVVHALVDEGYLTGGPP